MIASLADDDDEDDEMMTRDAREFLRSEISTEGSTDQNRFFLFRFCLSDFCIKSTLIFVWDCMRCGDETHTFFSFLKNVCLGKKCCKR